MCSVRACHMWLPGITCLFVKFGENLPRSFFENLKILKIPKFQKSEHGQFTLNFPLKHVITSANLMNMS